MSGYTEQNGTLYVDGISLNDIAQQYGTPTYVYSTDIITEQYTRLKNALSRHLPADRQPLLCFACKSNSNVAVLSLLRQLGSSLEIVSEGELKRGLAAGFNPDKIVSTGVGKSDSEITSCLIAGIHQFNVESIPELENIQRVAQALNKIAKVAFRLNPNVSGGGHHKISTGRHHDKFGLDEQTLCTAYELASTMSNVEPIGLSMHIGSQVFSVESFKTAFQKLPNIVQKLRDKRYSVIRLDIGGGFPIIYKDEKLLDLNQYAEWVKDIILPLNTEIIMEPGRYLVGNAGVLLSRVTYVKQGNSKKFLIIDAAMNDLIRPALYDAYHGIEPVANRNNPKEIYDVVGPICETGDTFTIDRELPTLKRGDLIVIQTAGAYGYCMASNYNTRGLPAEILAGNGTAYLIKERQNIEELIKRDIVPAHLKV